jgi:hypothetical protein
MDALLLQSLSPADWAQNALSEKSLRAAVA